MALTNVLKPWYVYRPGQIVRRVVRAVHPPGSPIQVLPLPWGCAVEADIRETVGRSIWTTGVYDLAVAEVLFRLADPELLSLDVGANLGAFTGLLALRSKEVWAFEPHPGVRGRLAGNVSRFSGRSEFAPCRLFGDALSDTDGVAGLEVPSAFQSNQGLSRVTTTVPGGLCVRTTRLDPLLADRSVGLLKLDVEGHESAVLRGAEDALAAGRVRHIVFEDHDGPDSAVCHTLSGFGYTLFAVGWRLTGPVVTTPSVAPHRRYEAPSFLATRDPGRAARRCRPGGWECLSQRPARQDER